MELMKEAGLNTLLGMGMTFLVLITLSLIISLFGKVLSGSLQQKKVVVVNEKKPAAKAPEKAPQKSLAEAEDVQEPAAVPVPAEGAEDPAIMAVIAGAVAAYEDGMSPEIVAAIAAAVAAAEEGTEQRRVLIPGASGFAVRKIRKSRSHVA